MSSHEPTQGPAAKARRQAIVDLAHAGGLASVDALAARFGVTQSTIRRDLARLQDAGRITRTFGGAMAAHAESSLRQRLGEATEQKRAIARWAASRVQPGDSILLDGGSTMGALASELAGPLHVVTPAMSVVHELAGAPDIEVDCLGGRLRAVSDGFVGPIAEAALERMTFDVVFLGADAVHAELGLCEADPQQTRLKQLAARRASAVFVLADSSKLGAQPFHAWTRLDGAWTLVTDEGADAEQLAAFAAAGIPVVLA